MIPPPEPNARLIIELMTEHDCQGFENTGSFFDVPELWHCPICCRSKREFARRNKNGELLCRVVRHHDHFEHHIEKQLRNAQPYAKQAMIASLCRFAPILICGDCNNADTAAKTTLGTPPEFSFAPFEIAAFILPLPNRAHTIDHKVAAQVYELARVQMRHIFLRLKSLVASHEDLTECGKRSKQLQP